MKISVIGSLVVVGTLAVAISTVRLVGRAADTPAEVAGRSLHFDRPSAGDNPGEEQPPPSGYAIPDAPALTPEEALKRFRLPAGYRIELVASEPLINTPVALDFDPDGRIWVVEMRGYQNNPDGSNRLESVGRIVVLEDTDGDGRMDRSRVYMDGLVLPRAVKVLSDGVLVGAPPNVWFTRDTNGDLRADEKVVIASDYGVMESNPANAPGALVWGMDNWIHSSVYSNHFRRIDGKWTKRPVPVLGHWGVGMDDFGRTYMNGNSGPMRANVIASHYHLRNPNFGGSGGVYEAISSAEENEVWPVRPTPGVNRGYMNGVLRRDGTLTKYTACCAVAIFRGDRLPDDVRGNYFVAEPAANLVRRSIVTEAGDGRISAANAYKKAEFLASTDERFRPVNIFSAPDGTLYIVDMYRGTLESHPFVTTYLKRQIYERGLDQPLDRGRIYRIVHESMKPGPAPRMSRMSTPELVGCLSHRNGWWRDTAQRLLVERNDRAAVAALRKLAAESTWEIARLHALWTLEGLAALRVDDLIAALGDKSAKIRAAAVRLAEPWLGNRDDARLLTAVTKANEDPASGVRLQVAASLGEVKTPEAEAALATLLAHHATQPYVIGAVASGLKGRELEFLQRLGQDRAWQEAAPSYEQVFGVLASAVFTEASAERVNRLLSWTAATGRAGWQRIAVLGSVSKPVRLSSQVSVPRELSDSADERIRSLASQLSRRLVVAEKAGAAGARLTPTELTAANRGEKAYIVYCAQCHQADGRGMPDTALPLAGSKWVLGPGELTAKIVLQGKQSKAALMPPWGGVLDDAAISAIVTYVRHHWGNNASAVSPEMVRKARSETQTMSGFWTEELLAQEAAQADAK
ncbi:MAG: HEAT repeat domain-containing protein [Verrucomicrobia bacterium]|nr:HEAT repeat domain-containing protein [Verrucomicrobiota bacterium]